MEWIVLGQKLADMSTGQESMVYLDWRIQTAACSIVGGDTGTVTVTNVENLGMERLGLTLLL